MSGRKERKIIGEGKLWFELERIHSMQSNNLSKNLFIPVSKNMNKTLFDTSFESSNHFAHVSIK
jgi:hypothetical protein